MSLLSLKQGTTMSEKTPIFFNKYKDKGLTGLANVGNSCYLNSCMQILSHTYELNDFLEKGDYKKRLNKKPDSIILLEWDKLRELMWSNNCTVAPNGFVNVIKKIAKIKDRDLFTGYSQNDIQEFLLFIIDCFHNALAREVDMNITGNAMNDTDNLAKICYTMMQNMYKREYSEILTIFYGIHVSEIISSTTNKTVSYSPEPFSVLSLSLPENNKSPTLYDCFDLYCKPEILSEENGNAWFNDKTKKNENALRSICFWNLPNIMIIDLKRWNGTRGKINTIVDAPLTNFDLSNYVKGYNSSTYVYDLYGVCNHGGGVLGGHYTAYIKNANGKWYEINDTNVSVINETKIISAQSYCFFYRKRSL